MGKWRHGLDIAALILSASLFQTCQSTAVAFASQEEAFNFDVPQKAAAGKFASSSQSFIHTDGILRLMFNQLSFVLLCLNLD